MKARMDFVTNSSSSSFVIGTVDTTDTIDDIYLMIRQMYIDLLTVKKEFMKDCDQYNMYWNEEYQAFRVKPKNNSKRKQYDKWEEEKYTLHIIIAANDRFGIDVTQRFPVYSEWLEYKTYAEYEQYWVNRIKKNSEEGKFDEAPFSIGDYLKDLGHISLENCCCEITNDGRGIDNHVLGKESLTSWYLGFDIYDVTNPDDQDDVEYFKKKHNILDIPNEKAVAYLLGRYCIHSYSGMLPQYIVDSLTEISEYSCNHMG